MLEVNHSELERAVELHYIKRAAGVSMHIWGMPGIGKTESVFKVGRKIAKDEGLVFSAHPRDYKGHKNKFVVVPLIMSQMDASDLKGIPTNDDGYTKWLIPRNLPMEGQGIIFFDELNRAPELVRSSTYSLIHGKFLGDYICPDDYIMIAAGNRVEDKVGVYDMEPTLSNRFLHYLLMKPTADEWVENYASPNDLDHRVIAYVYHKKSTIYGYDPKNKSDMAFPTPRSWAKAAYMMKGITDADVVGGIVSAAVGKHIGTEFESFVRLMNKYDVEKMVNGKIKFPEKDDERYAVVSAIAEWYSGKEEKLESIVDFSIQIEPEYGMLMIMLTKQLGQEAFKKQISPMLMKKKEFGKRYAKYLLSGIGMLFGNLLLHTLPFYGL